MCQDLVSIIIPVYNAGNTLQRCVDSILNQTYKNIEIILVDDGSKDNSLEVCTSYSGRDPRVKTIHTENQGSGPARNTGIEASNGKWAYFPDSDDFLLPEAIEVMLKSQSINNCDLLVFGFDTYNSDNKLIRKKTCPSVAMDGDSVRSNYEHHCMMHDPLCIQGAPWNKFFSMDVIKKNKVTYPALRRHQDECFISRYVAHTKRVAFIPDVLYYYYANDASAVKRKYPIDYVDCVKGVYDIKSKLYYSWNPNNIKVKEVVSDEFICNFIWALELSFNPKFSFTVKERFSWMKNQIKDVNFRELNYGLVNKRPYQNTVVNLLRADRMKLAYALLWLKSKIKTN